MNWIGNYLAMFDVDGNQFGKIHTQNALPPNQTQQSFAKLLKKKQNESLTLRSDQKRKKSELQIDSEDKIILEFYKPLIDRLFIGRKPTVLPFFKDLYEASQHPSLTTYFRQTALDTWYRVNVSLSMALEVVAVGGNLRNKVKASEVNRLATRLSAYLNENIQPIIYINLPDKVGNEKRIHILRVVSAEWGNGHDQYTVKVADPNFTADDNIQKLSFKKINSRPSDVEVIYTPYEYDQLGVNGVTQSLSSVEITPFFDLLSVDAIQGWKDLIDVHGLETLEKMGLY